MAAFGAGLHACDVPWRTIAAVISRLGMGSWDPMLLQVAVEDWSAELLDDEDAGLTPSDLQAIAMTSPSRTGRS